MLNLFNVAQLIIILFLFNLAWIMLFLFQIWAATVVQIVIVYFISTADSFKVKVNLLTAPSLINQVRGVDEKHSQKLQKEMEKNPDCQYLKLLVHIPGVVAADVVHDKINSGDYNLEVIGGNHTRIALQSMKQAKKEFVDAAVYAGLSPIQALSLGIKHNDTHNHAKAMGFHDYVHLFRKIWHNTISDLEHPTMKERSQMNANLANMLRLSVSTPWAFSYLKYQM